MTSMFAIVEMNGCILNLAVKKPAMVVKTVHRTMQTSSAKITRATTGSPVKSNTWPKTAPVLIPLCIMMVAAVMPIPTIRPMDRSVPASRINPAFFAILMDKQEKGLLVLTVGAIVAAVVGVVLYVRKKEVGFLCATAVSIVTAVIFRFANHVLPLSKSFNEPTTNQIAYWAICNGLIALIVTMFFYAVTKKKEGMTIESYGIKANGRTILASLGTAVFGVAILYAVLFLIQAVFGTDFSLTTHP